MLIAILSDSHDNWVKLTRAIEVANEHKCEHLFFAGDLIAPPQLQILQSFNGKVHFVWGNNEGEKVKLTQSISASPNITLYGVVEGDSCETKIDGLKIFMNHYPVHGRHAAMSQLYDIVIYGHDHIYHEEKVGKTLLLNPGEVQGYKTGISTCIILDTQSREIEKITL